MENNAGRDVVLGTVDGYDFEKIKPFVITLRKSGFKGDLCLFTSRIDKYTFRQLQQNNVRVIPFKYEYPFAPKSLVSKDLIPQKFPNGISVKYLRYILYYLYLSKHRDKYRKVMISDVKDVIFQRDPFEFDFDDCLYCFLEDKIHTIKASHFNSGRILRHFGQEGLDKIGDNYPSCAGTTFGSVPAILDYLKNMISIINTIEPIGGGDQGVHNYLIYTKQLKNMKLIKHATGPVLTIGSRLKKQIRFNKEGFVLNDNGAVVNIVHQYNRHPALFQNLLRKYNLTFAMPFYLKVIYMYKNRLESLVGWDFFNQFGWKLVNTLKWKIS